LIEIGGIDFELRNDRFVRHTIGLDGWGFQELAVALPQLSAGGATISSAALMYDESIEARKSTAPANLSMLNMGSQ